MKRLLNLVVCFLLIQAVQASSVSGAASLSKSQTLQSNKYNLQNNRRDTTNLPDINHPAPLTHHGSIIKRRLDSLQKDIPLDYNEYVQSYIDLYLRNRDEMGQVLGLSKYYFPIYEKAFHDAGIPEEIKYLSVVESKLDPNAVSHVGATGPWQFMFTTARTYGLSIDEYTDERRDPIQASYAAAAYIKEAYQEFGDWLLAIASYNCGTSSVERAIKSAGATDFWSIRQYLPPQTRNYVPAYIAIAYLMNYYNHHDIVLQPCSFSLKTDTVLVNKYLPLSTISQALNIDMKELSILNPSYKRLVINGTSAKPRRLVIPQIDKEKYSALYDALNNPNLVEKSSKPAYASYHDNSPEKTPAYHVVKRGETLRDIADNFGIELHELKTWNHLRSNKAVVGMKLRVTDPSEGEAYKSSTKNHHSYVAYKVKKGDTLKGIAAKFEGASIERIKSVNGLKKDKLEPGTTIKI
jgi:membrane-bound lytic murein transglycosylase D